MFRPYNDVRFHPGPLYKEHAALVVDQGPDGGGACYLQLSTAGLLLAGGYYSTASDQVQRLREAVDDAKTGPALVRVVGRLRGAGWQVDGQELKRVPKPYDPDSPRADLLRRKSLTASRSEAPQPWLHTREALDRVRAAWEALGPLNRWLQSHVGASRLEPARR